MKFVLAFLALFASVSMASAANYHMVVSGANSWNDTTDAIWSNETLVIRIDWVDTHGTKWFDTTPFVTVHVDGDYSGDFDLANLDTTKPVLISIIPQGNFIIHLTTDLAVYQGLAHPSIALGQLRVLAVPPNNQ